MTSSRPKPKVWLVEDGQYAPGRILAVFAHEKDALDFASTLDQRVYVESRTLFYGQPSNRGYNE